MGFSEDVMQSLVYRLREFSGNMPTLRKLTDALNKDFELREKEYNLRLYELSQKGVTEEDIEKAVVKFKKRK